MQSNIYNDATVFITSPVVLDAVNPGKHNLQSNSLGGNNTAASIISSPTLIGQDMWKQLKRVSVPIFTGDKKTYQNWKAALHF